MSKVKSRPLTLQQIKFLNKFIETGNATKSYLEFYKCDPISARSRSHTLLTEPKCQEYLSERVKKAVESTDASLAQIVQEIHKIAFNDLNEIASVDENGVVNLKGGADLNKLDGISLSKSESSSSEGSSFSQSISVKRSDKLKALVELAKLKGAYKNDDSGRTKGNLRDSNRRLLSALRKFKQSSGASEE